MKHSHADSVYTRIWEEVAEEQDPFSAAECYCHGYDVFNEILSRSTWIEYLFLLFQGERPTCEERNTLESVALALANPGPRDHSVRAAMNAGVGGSTAASTLIAALAVGGGGFGGGREVSRFMDMFQRCGTELDGWAEALQGIDDAPSTLWPSAEHCPGFSPWRRQATRPVRAVLHRVARTSQHESLIWLDQYREELERLAGAGLSMVGVVGAALRSLGFDSQQGELLYLILRLPGAAAHALEQRSLGWRKYPFFKDAIKVQKEDEAGTQHG